MNTNLFPLNPANNLDSGKSLVGIFSWVLWLGLFMFVIAPASFGQSSPEENPRIAVLDLELISTSKEEGAALADTLRNEFVNFGTFTVLSRGQINKLLNEQAFQLEGLTDQAEAVRAGKLLNAKYILTGRLTKLTGAYQLNIQMIEVQTAVIVRSVAPLHRGDFLDLLTDLIPSVAATLAQVEKAPGQEPPPVVVQPELPQKEEPPPIAQDLAPQETQTEAPVMQAEKPTWALWMGVPLLVAGFGVQMSALSTNDEATVLAEEARSENSTSKYAEAKQLREDADSGQTNAALLSIGGAIFLIYYMTSDSPETAGISETRAIAEAPFQLQMTHNSLLAGWKVRW